ncbi:hypothetical protein [Ramlibacter sp.]|uniref:hypothetical protein n=1 Tax=Ramlibacter sp. TaxID=1917967 RepID=UPI002D0E6238|nr:hypothetical protein [Ramlibacter sp.]HWI83662.1 hypothetical protein [Ramlibacter sp.]
MLFLLRRFGFLIAAALLLPPQANAQAPSGGAASAGRAAFRLCDAEGFMALNMGRNYMLGRRDRESVLPYVRGDEFGQKLALELFDRVDKGEVKHYADFAAEKLYDCARRQNMALPEPVAKAKICYARADIPFFLHADRQAGLDRPAAEEKTAARLKNRELYPPALIGAVAQAVYDGADAPDLRQLMGMVFWSCLQQDAARRS